MSALWIRALGPLDVMAGGVHVSLGGAKQRIVLACLALRANSVVTTDSLIEAVWGDNTPAKPVPQLQVYVANLRQILEPARPRAAAPQRLISKAGGYLLNVTDQELDLFRFRECVKSGELSVEAGNLAMGADYLRQALELFVDPIFPDLADVPLLRPELDKLMEIHLSAYQDMIEVELALGRHTQLVGEIQALIAEHPYRESLWAQLVLALYRCGRQAEALAASRKADHVFRRELGIDPGPQLKELEKAVLQRDPSLAAPALDGHRRPRQRIDNLPSEHTPFVGRDKELEEIWALFIHEGCRLLTIFGPGGTGKTRLALATAGRIGGQMPDGVCWVDLAPLSDLEQVPAAIASALGLEDWGPNPLGVITSFLRSRRLLLVLDNFEHLEEAWSVVSDMLTLAPQLRILITSRRPLGLRAEYEYDLAPLALPQLDPLLPLQLLIRVPAVQLFLARGRAVRPVYKLTPENALLVARICHRLDGLPLAIELAAARLRMSDEQALLHDLEANLSALPGGYRDLPDRQRTLTDTITWSYQLLSRHERHLFDRLGVFAADPSVEAVQAVLDGSIDQAAVDALLVDLSRHSLLRVYTDEDGLRRISMLQTIREYARDRLNLIDEAAQVRLRHAKFYVSVADELGPQLWGPRQIDAFRRLRADAADLRQAFLWSARHEGSRKLALRLVGQLWHYWEMTEDVSEPCDIALALLSGAPNDSPGLRAPALSGSATLCWVLGRNREATALHEQAREAFAMAGNYQGVAWATVCAAVQAMDRNDMLSAHRLAETALSLPLATPRTRIAALICLSRQLFYDGHYSRSLDLCNESVALARQLGDRLVLGVTLTNLAESTEQIGDFDTAEKLLREALVATLELGAQANLVAYLESLASIYVHQKRVDLATRVAAAAAAYRAERSHPLTQPELRRIESMLAIARTEAGPVRFGLAWARGQAMTLPQAIEEIVQEESATNPTAHVSVHRTFPTAAEGTGVYPAPW